MLDISAPIVPFEGLGGIKLYSTRDDLHDLLIRHGVQAKIIQEHWVRYDIENSVELFFHLKNNKLFRITTLDGYIGKLFSKIGVGITADELIEIDPSFKYNDFEEVWESPKGIFIEMDAKTNAARWISVFIKELDSDEFEQANW